MLSNLKQFELILSIPHLVFQGKDPTFSVYYKVIYVLLFRRISQKEFNKNKI